MTKEEIRDRFTEIGMSLAEQLRQAVGSRSLL
jgi:hypothetical protein